MKVGAAQGIPADDPRLHTKSAGWRRFAVSVDALRIALVRLCLLGRESLRARAEVEAQVMWLSRIGRRARKS